MYRRTYDQMDLRVSFMITDQIQTFLEGTNILGEENYHGALRQPGAEYVDTGARWAVGARANF